MSLQVSPRLQSRRATVEDFYDDPHRSANNLLHHASEVASSRNGSSRSRPITNIIYEDDPRSRMHESFDNDNDSESADTDTIDEIHHGGFSSASNTLDTISEDPTEDHPLVQDPRLQAYGSPRHAGVEYTSGTRGIHSVSINPFVIYHRAHRLPPA